MNHFLQSKAWRGYQDSLGAKTFESSGQGWHVMAVEDTHHGVKRLYTPYGPEADSPEALERALGALENLSKKRGAAFVRVEPTSCDEEFEEAIMVANGYHRAPSIQPNATWCIDLTQEKSALLKGIGSTNRNLLNGFERRGMQIVQSTDSADVAHLSSILEQISASKNDFTAHDHEYLERQAHSLFEQGAARLFLVRYEDEVIAASLVYEDENTRYYAHSGASLEHRKLRAGNVLVSYMMMDAKEAGLKEFDLYGIAPDDDPEHPWAGFTKFKKSFGGFQKTYLGTWEKAQKPLMYGIYQKARKLADKVGH